MRAPFGRGLLALALCAGCAESSEPAARAAPEAGAPAPGSWIRVSHPQLPLSFDAPPDMEIQEVQRFSLGRLRRTDGRSDPVRVFGLHALASPGTRFHALEVAFFWVTAAIVGASTEQLGELSRRMREPTAGEEFLRAVLLAEHPGARLQDQGLEVVDGHPARRFAVTVYFVPGSDYEHAVAGELVLLAVPPGAAVVIAARIDPSATPEERDMIFPGIVRSLRVGERGPQRAVPTASSAGPTSRGLAL